MGKIMLIEHSGEGCGIGYAEEGVCVCEVKGDKISGPNHSSGLGLMMSDCLAEAGVAIKDIEAIAISEGPGSYTSLRTGTAVAQGICFALDIPLIAVSTHEIIHRGILESFETDNEAHICSLIDARRMEVAAVIYNKDGVRLNEYPSLVLSEIDPDLFWGNNKIYFGGTGVPKLASLVKNNDRFTYTDIEPSARFMAHLAERNYQKNEYVNINFFSPVYFKNPNITTSHKVLNLL